MVKVVKFIFSVLPGKVTANKDERVVFIRASYKTKEAFELIPLELRKIAIALTVEYLGGTIPISYGMSNYA